MCTTQDIINIFIITMSLTENCHLNLQLHSESQSFIVSFNSLFSYPAVTLLLWFTLTASFSVTAGSCFQEKQKRALNTYFTLPAKTAANSKQQTDNVCD